MRVTTKGQVTVPLDVSRTLGIVPGTEPTFGVRGTSIEVKKATDAGRGAGIVRRLERRLAGAE